MNRINRLGFLVVGVAAIAGPGSLARAADDAGAKVYAAKCASCHGKDGKGNPAMAKVFKVEPDKLNLLADATLAKPDADLIKTTTDGSGKMPAYKGKLTDAEIAQTIAYVRSLGKPKEPSK